MNAPAWAPPPLGLRHLDALLRTEVVALRQWATAGRPAYLGLCVVAILVGAGSFGAAMGSWRSPLQSFYVAIKLPLAMLLTTLGNSLLNAMLAPLLGVNVSFRQTSAVILMSFAIMAMILGALSPVALFVVWNTPPLTSGTSLASAEYNFMQLTLAVFIAAAGVTANLRLLPLLVEWARSARDIGMSRYTVAAWRVLIAWLAVNLFLGSQICWVLRPFIWDPAGPVRFIGREYFRGSFFETVFEAVRRLFFG